MPKKLEVTATLAKEIIVEHEERTYRIVIDRNADNERVFVVDIKPTTAADDQYRRVLEIDVDELTQFREDKDPPFNLPAKFEAATSAMLELNPDGSTKKTFPVRDLSGSPLTRLNQLLQPFIIRVT